LFLVFIFLFLSKKLKHSFAGYAFEQKKKLIGKKKRLEELRFFKKILDKYDKKLLHICEWLLDKFSHMDIYYDMWQTQGKYIIRNGPDDDKILKIKGHNNYKINYVFEGKLVNNFFNSQAKNQVLMSATIGDFEI
jgi:hypothetical protein